MTSNYLPPFSAAERVDQPRRGDQPRADAPERSAHPAPADSEHEATYADFLGDEVED